MTDYRILVVDDERLVLRSIEKTLLRAGFDVENRIQEFPVDEIRGSGMSDIDCVFADRAAKVKNVIKVVNADDAVILDFEPELDQEFLFEVEFDQGVGVSHDKKKDSSNCQKM